jgi:hypothetical protein
MVNQEQAAQDQGKEEKLRAWKQTLEKRTFKPFVALRDVSNSNYEKPSSSSPLRCPDSLYANTFLRHIRPTPHICPHSTLKRYVLAHNMMGLGAPHRCHFDFHMYNASRKVTEA